MADKKKTDDLEMERIKLERYKVKGKIIIAIITVLFGSGLGTYINYSIQSRQLKQQKLLNKQEIELQEKKAEADIELQKAKTDAEHRQSEMKYLGDYIAYALEDDDEKRIRFAEYFSTLTLSDDLQKKWKEYHDGILQTQKQLVKKEILYETALIKKESGEGEIDNEELVQLDADIKRLKKSLNPLKEDIIQKKIFMLLEKDMKPLYYIDNEFGVQTIEGDKVISDLTTGLMWQQSGSKDYMSYDEANIYIAQLNNSQFAGHSDWRLPTLEEAITLLEQTKKNEGLYIDPLFDQKQDKIWTSDLFSSSPAWRLARRGGGTPSALIVRFNSGKCGINFIAVSSNIFVRAVR